MRKNYINSTIFLVFVHILFCTTLFAQNKTDSITSDDEKFLILFNPTGTEIYELGSEVIIEWDYGNVDKIAIQYLSENNVWEDIASNLDASKKEYKWIINANLPQIFKVRIIDLSDSNIFFVTPYYIKVVPKSRKFLKKLNYELNKSSSLPKLKLMPLGNSITRGYTEPVPEYFNGYRKKLKFLTDENGLNFDFVGHVVNGNFDDNQHEGNGGWHANHWQGHSKSLLDSVTKFINANLPDIVLLQIGTNDIGSYYLPGNDNTIDTTVNDISNMLDSIYNVDPNIFIILAKIVNRTDDSLSSTINETVTTSAFNNALELMANIRIANGDNLKLVDMENALSYPDDLCDDGVHPDSIGYNKMANVWFDAVVDILPKLNAKVYLEGAYIEVDSMIVSLSDNSLFPKENPFSIAPWNYSGTEKVDVIPINIVDWVLVSLRTDSLEISTVAQRAAFLRADGQIVDLDGTSPITFATYEDYYYIVIEHRNHLPIMSSQKVLISP